MSLETAINRAQWRNLAAVQAVALRHWRRSGIEAYRAYADMLQDRLDGLAPLCKFTGLATV